MVSISPADPGDAGQLTRIAQAAKRHWGYPERWLTLWAEQLTVTPQEIAQNATFTGRSGSEILGFAMVTRRDALACLEHLWVLPEGMGRGVGRALFQHAAARAAAQGATEMEVQSDPNAVGFYLHMGCRLTGEHVTNLDGQERRLPVLRLTLP